MRFLYKKTKRLGAADEGLSSVKWARIQATYPGIKQYRERLAKLPFADYEQVVLSPGIARERIPVEHRSKVSSDISLFVEAADAPILGITGTNGKSTVTSMIDHVLNFSKRRVATGGNLGVPALDLLRKKKANYYLLELSSFQLEELASLPLRIGVLLNFAEDHLDRHAHSDDYLKAKLRILDQAQTFVVNRDQEEFKHLVHDHRCVSFGSDWLGNEGHYTIDQGTLYRGFTSLYDFRAGNGLAHHGQMNVAACWAVCSELGVSDSEIADAIPSFKTLPHRFEEIGWFNNRRWINDSKATNSSAAKAALEQMGQPCVWIAGGLIKEANLNVLQSVLAKKATHVVILGLNPTPFEALAQSCGVSYTVVQSMPEAVSAAMSQSTPGQSVVLSPAAASLDQYQDYKHRGECFRQAVEHRYQNQRSSA